MSIIFFDSQGVVHKEFVPQGKTVNAELYKGVMDRLLNRIQRGRPAAFCSGDFFILHDKAPTHKPASVCQFSTPNNVTTLYHPPPSPRTLQIYLRYFLFPKLKMKLRGLHFADVAEIQEAVADELKKVQKEESSAVFQKLYDRAKACIYMPMERTLNKKYVSSIFKKISPKTFEPHCVFNIITAVFSLTNKHLYQFTCTDYGAQNSSVGSQVTPEL